MKIAVDVLSIRPDGSAGGATGFAVELIKGFAQSEGNKVYVLCAEWNREYLKKILPSNVVFLQIGGQRKITNIQLLDRLIFRLFHYNRRMHKLRNEGIDILYCPFSAVSNKETGIPVVSTILDIQHEYYPQFFDSAELEHRRKFYREIVKKAETVTCISDYTKRTFCEKYGYPEERAHTIYIAIQNRFEQEDTRILTKLDLNNREYIVYPANFWEHKNHKLLLTAFARYALENSNAFLVLTGNPLEKETYYKDLIKGLKIEEKVVITGYVTTEELFSILKNAKGLIFPSLFEGFGIPVVEAMQQRLLIACSNATSLPEIGCNSIFYFDPRKPDEIVNGIRYLYENEITDSIIADYEEKLKAYRSDVMVKEYLTLFEKVVLDKDLLLVEEYCSGIFDDGWAGEQIEMQMVNRRGYKVHLMMELPAFVRESIPIRLEHNRRTREFILEPGKHIDLVEEVTDDKEIFCLRFKKCWLPSELLHSDDTRRLSVMVKCIELMDKNGSIIPMERN